MSGDAVMVLVVAAALAFAFSNGFHDTFDLISTALSTGAAPPRLAIAVAALLNFAGAFAGVAVAATIAHDIVDAGAIAPGAVLAGLVGSIAWNLATWRMGLPSSSHALIGGLVGAALADAGSGALKGAGLLDKVLVPALLAPLAAFLVAIVAIALFYRLFGSWRPGPVTRAFRRAQIASGGLLAFAHGANDGQKTMGVVTLALIANGSLGVAADPPAWVIVTAAAAIGLGTYGGGWRMMRGAAGARIIKMDAAQGFSAQGAGGGAILAATLLGYPISSTHAISGGVMGAGAAKRLSAVRWGVASNILVAWLLTLPATAAIGAVAYGVGHLLGG